MSDPDILLTIKAYSRLKQRNIDNLVKLPSVSKEVEKKIEDENNRLDELNDQLVAEWERRGNG